MSHAPARHIVFTRRTARALLAGAVTAVCTVSALAQPAPDLTALDLEDLGSIEVTSVSRRAQRLADSAAAVYVITREDLRRSGATTIQDALRMVPGVMVARIDGNKWAVNVRGAEDRYANKLLVLVDGRSVYSPLFSGTYWEAQDMPLEEVDRIEVIRGPGGTMWGANAVNGIINIITRDASETVGGFVSASAGTFDAGILTARVGRQIGSAGGFRVYARGRMQDALSLPDGREADDKWDMMKFGARLDLHRGSRDSFTVIGEAYRGSEHQVFPTFQGLFQGIQPTAQRVPFSGGFVLGRWHRHVSASQATSVQVVADHTNREDIIVERRNVLDIDVQHEIDAFSRHRVVVGAGFRQTSDDTRASATVGLNPASSTQRIASLFVQDEVELVRDILRLTAGTKIEHHTFTGLEMQPTVRLGATKGVHGVWTSWSRAVRTPSRAERDVEYVHSAFTPGTLFPGAPPALVVLTGSDAFTSEYVNAFEAGYRVRIGARASFDVAAFSNQYDHLRRAIPASPQLDMSRGIPTLVIPALVANGGASTTRGVELAVDLRPAAWWRMQGTATKFRTRLDLDDSVTATAADSTITAQFETDADRLMLGARSTWDLTPAVDLTTEVRVLRNHSAQLPDYETADVRLGWRPTGRVELAIVGQSLLSPRVIEYVGRAGVDAQSGAVPRRVYLKTTLRF